jgi:hypothetical protein
MTTLASSLLDFILDLLRDPQAAANFEADPQGALSDAGLDDVCVADVDNLVPVLAESVSAGGAMAMTHAAAATSPMQHSNGGSQDGGWSGHEGGWSGHEGGDTPPTSGGQEGPSHSGGDDHHMDDGGHMGVVEYIKYIQTNFTYTEVDASHSVWAGGDAYQLFGDENVVATGGSVIAGDDADARYDNSVDLHLAVDDSFNGSGNTTEGDGNAVGQGNSVDNSDNSDNSTTISDSGNDNSDNSDNSVNDSGNSTEISDSGNDNSDNSTNVSDSGNDNSTNVSDSGNDNSDNSVNDSGNEYTDNSSDTDYDVNVEDSFQDNSDNSTEVQDSGNEYEYQDNSTQTELDVHDNAVALAEDDAFADA